MKNRFSLILLPLAIIAASHGCYEEVDIPDYGVVARTRIDVDPRRVVSGDHVPVTSSGAPDGVEVGAVNQRDAMRHITLIDRPGDVRPNVVACDRGVGRPVK